MQQAATAGPSSEQVHKKKRTEEDFFIFIDKKEHSSMDYEILAEFELHLKEKPIQFSTDLPTGRPTTTFIQIGQSLFATFLLNQPHQVIMKGF